MFSKQELGQDPAGEMNQEGLSQEWKGLGKHCYTHEHLSSYMLCKLRDEALKSVTSQRIISLIGQKAPAAGMSDGGVNLIYDTGL